MDKYDRVEPEPEAQFFDAQQEPAKVMPHQNSILLNAPPDVPVATIPPPDVPGLDVTLDPFVEVTDKDTYAGSSPLKLQHSSIPIDPNIQVPKSKRKVSHRDVKYPQVYAPPESDPLNYMEKNDKEPLKAIGENEEPSQPLRRSTRRTRWKGTKDVEGTKKKGTFK